MLQMEPPVQVQLGCGLRMWAPFLTTILNGRAVAMPSLRMSLANPDGCRWGLRCWEPLGRQGLQVPEELQS